MENKPKTIFKSLDSQNEKIENINQKLENIDINDLRALAKKTWKLKDYKTAQKYYNQISLLDPLDWEAPFYSSLVNVLEITWVNAFAMLNHLINLITSTVEYIDDCSKVENKKEAYADVFKPTLFYLDGIKRSLISNTSNIDDIKLILRGLIESYIVLYDLDAKIDGKNSSNITNSIVAILNRYSNTKIPLNSSQEKLKGIIPVECIKGNISFGISNDEIYDEIDSLDSDFIDICTKGVGRVKPKNFNRALTLGLILSALLLASIGFMVYSGIKYYSIYYFLVPVILNSILFVALCYQLLHLKTGLRIDSIFYKERYSLEVNSNDRLSKKGKFQFLTLNYYLSLLSCIILYFVLVFYKIDIEKTWYNIVLFIPTILILIIINSYEEFSFEKNVVYIEYKKNDFVLNCIDGALKKIS